MGTIFGGSGTYVFGGGGVDSCVVNICKFGAWACICDVLRQIQQILYRSAVFRLDNVF